MRKDDDEVLISNLVCIMRTLSVITDWILFILGWPLLIASIIEWIPMATFASLLMIAYGLINLYRK